MRARSLSTTVTATSGIVLSTRTCLLPQYP